MATRLPGAIPRRPTTTLTMTLTTSTTTTTTTPARTPFSHTSTRSATIIRRPRRPYTFTQLVQLSDGSTYTARTTSPQALYRSTKDTRNHALWQPNDASLRNVEVDEAGKLAAFRGRFGRGWDAEPKVDDHDQAAAEPQGGDEGPDAPSPDSGAAAAARKKAALKEDPFDALGDLISGYARPEDFIQAPTTPLKKKK